MKEFEQKRGRTRSNKNEADRAHGGTGQLSQPSVWEGIQAVEPLRLANSFEPLLKSVNQKKLAVWVNTVES